MNVLYDYVCISTVTVTIMHMDLYTLHNITQTFDMWNVQNIHLFMIYVRNLQQQSSAVFLFSDFSI